MGNKTNIVKPNGNSDDVIRAALRKDNLNHEAEIQMLMAICEKHGIIIKRDENDSTRQFSPLKMAEDAILIDTTNMDIQLVIKTIAQYIGGNNVL